jgi:hypothetical protein
MKQTEVLDPRIEAYVDAVSRALADIEPDEREAMLDDLRGHASALVAEDPAVDLRVRLGEPAVYAHDLRDAAGLTRAERATGERLREAWDRGADSIVGRAGRRAWSDFAPTWAFGRGVAVAWILASWLGLAHGHAIVVLVVGGVAGWLLADRFSLLGGAGPFGAVLRSAVDLAVGITLLVLLVTWTSTSDTTESSSGFAEPNPAPGVVVNGNSVANIQAFGPDGKLAPVALFDQDGTPLDVTASTANLTCPDGLTTVPVPYLNTAGTPIANAFPARGLCVDGNDVVVQDAVPMTDGVTVQTWGTASMPSRGQTIITDDSGVFAGTVSAPTATSPSPSAPASVPAAAGTPTPSASR